MKLTAPLQKLSDQIKATYGELLQQETTAVNTALYLGALLNEAKEIVGHGAFIEYRKKLIPGLTDDRAERYMKSAANVLKQIDLGDCTVPASRLLICPADELPNDAAREAQQLLFDFTRDKTIKDCLAGVVVDGDEPHRITRAANGKKLGGKGGDRKDWPTFIGKKLSDIATHLKHWESFLPAQVEVVLSKFAQVVVKWPTPVLVHLKKIITEELKTR